MFDEIITVLRVVLGLSTLGVLNTIKLVKGLYWSTYTQVWDVNLHIANSFAPELDPKKVIRPGKPGANGTPFPHSPKSLTDFN
jgi:hypothetical protein